MDGVPKQTKRRKLLEANDTSEDSDDNYGDDLDGSDESFVECSDRVTR